MFPDVTVADVAARYVEGPVTDLGTTAQIETRILDAVDEIRSNWGNSVTNRLASGALTENAFKRIVAEAALRILRNPEGIYQENEGNYGYRTSQRVASGYLGFSEQDVATLTGQGVAGIGVSTMPLHQTGGGSGGWW